MSGAVKHWWVQRLTSVLLIPLTGWMIWVAVSVAGADHATAVAFMGNAVNIVMASLMAIIVFHHAQLGMQVIYEDYLPDGLGRTLLLLTRLFCLAGALAFIWLMVSLGRGA